MVSRTSRSAAASDEDATGNRNPLVDAYIARSAPFARPILAHLRHVVHDACPDVEESMKWGMPFFVRRGNLCHMAAFKAHCAFGFWRGKEIPDLPQESEAAMGNFGRILSLDDLPSRRSLTGFVKAAMKLDESGKKAPAATKAPKPSLDMPDDLARALRGHPAAAKQFDAFSPSARREYIEWVIEAKRAETRASRIATTVEWIAEGKPRNWKYMKC